MFVKEVKLWSLSFGMVGDGFFIEYGTLMSFMQTSQSWKVIFSFYTYKVTAGIWSQHSNLGILSQYYHSIFLYKDLVEIEMGAFL